MIQGLSRAVTLYLAPLLSLTALLLTLFAYLAPVVILQSQVALLVVSPSAELTQPGRSANVRVDGATIRFGALDDASPFNCTAASLSPTFDLSVLPANTPRFITAPTSTSPGFIAVSLGFSALFVLLFTLISFRSKLGPRLGARLDNPTLGRALAWIGLLGFLIGLTAFLIIRMWFGKAVDDFNLDIVQLGQQGPKLVAAIGNGFTMVWVAYAFLAVPLVCTLMKLHVTAGGPVGKA